MYNYINPKTGKPAPLLSEHTWAVIQKNKEFLDSQVIYDRDFNFSFFGGQPSSFLPHSHVLTMPPTRWATLNASPTSLSQKRHIAYDLFSVHNTFHISAVVCVVNVQAASTLVQYAFSPTQVNAYFHYSCAIASS
jgi:hypothetical protein